MTKMILAACLLSAGLASPVLAANATRPYANCDRKIDNCGPTGNDRVEDLNAQQLGGTPQTAPMPMQASPNSGAPMPMGQGPSR